MQKSTSFSQCEQFVVNIPVMQMQLQLLITIQTRRNIFQCFCSITLFTKYNLQLLVQSSPQCYSFRL